MPMILSRGAALTALALLLVPLAQGQTPTTATVARAQTVDGTVFVTRAEGQRAILAEGSALRAGDSLNTTRNSTVRMRFTDGSETLLRPESSMTVQAYSFNRDEPQGDSLVLRLVKGGLRAITGTIGKRGNQDAYQLNARTATIGIRGTDYSVRLCADDCNLAQATPAPSARSTPVPVVIARMVRLQGRVLATRDASPVEMSEGSALYVGDRLEADAGAHAVLVFRDNSRITLNGGSALLLTQYVYDQGRPTQGSMLIELLKGGLRAATGLMARNTPDQVRFRTTTATIGIRGTQFDLACGPAATAGTTGAEPGSASCDQAVYARTRDGIIALAANDGVEIVLPAGETGTVPGPGTTAQTLASPPAYFDSLTTPAPESIDADPVQLFGAVAPPSLAEQGVFLSVREGRVVLAQGGQQITVEAGESAYAGGSAVPQRLSTPPPVLNRDPFLSDRMLDQNMCRR